MIIVPADNPAGITTPADLAKADKIVTGNPETAPHGTKAKEFLTSLGQWDGLESKFVFAENAAQTVDYVARGEVDAGLVFASEVLGNDPSRSSTRRRRQPSSRSSTSPRRSRPSQAALAEKFVEFLSDPEAQKILIDNGFKPAPASSATRRRLMPAWST